MNNKSEVTDKSNTQGVSDKTLVEIAAKTGIIGTESGRPVQRVQAELMLRNNEALREATQSAERSSQIIRELTLILGLIAFLQLVLGIWGPYLSYNLMLAIISTIGIVIIIFLAFRDLIKDIKGRDKTHSKEAGETIKEVDQNEKQPSA